MSTFRQLRKAKGYSTAEFCTLAGISNTTLVRLEAGKPVSLLTAGKACRALGVELEQVEGIVLTTHKG